MGTLIERRVPHRLVVVSSDGSLNMEAVVATLLNVRRPGVQPKAVVRYVLLLYLDQRTIC